MHQSFMLHSIAMTGSLTVPVLGFLFCQHIELEKELGTYPNQILINWTSYVHVQPFSWLATWK